MQARGHANGKRHAPHAALLLALSLCGLGGLGLGTGCTRTDVVLQMASLPEGTTTLRLFVRRDTGAQSDDTPDYAVGSVVTEPYTIGARLGGVGAGEVRFSVGAFSGDGCLLGTWTQTVREIAEQPTVPLDPEQFYEATPCRNGPLQINTVVSERDGTTQRLKLLGWGFTPDTKVAFSMPDSPAPTDTSVDLNNVSATRLETKFPDLGQQTSRQVTIQVTRGDGLTIQDTFPVFDSRYSLITPPLYPEAAVDGVQPPFRLFVGGVAKDLDGDGDTDLAIGCNDDQLAGCIRVYWNKGDGSFDPYLEIPVTGAVRGITAGNFRGGKYRDIVVTRAQVGIGTSPGALAPVVFEQVTAAEAIFRRRTTQTKTPCDRCVTAPSSRPILQAWGCGRLACFYRKVTRVAAHSLRIRHKRNALAILIYNIF